MRIPGKISTVQLQIQGPIHGDGTLSGKKNPDLDHPSGPGRPLEVQLQNEKANRCRRRQEQGVAAAAGDGEVLVVV